MSFWPPADTRVLFQAVAQEDADQFTLAGRLR
jgi:hypothetical protein